MKKQRIRKLKTLQKILKSNGFRDPMQILCDGSFLLAVDNVENGVEVLLRYFEEYPKFSITKCEFEKYKKLLNGKDKKNDATDDKKQVLISRESKVAKDFSPKKTLGQLSGHCEILKCDCEGRATCLYDNKIIKATNKHHYMLATDTKYYEKMYKKLKIPVISIKKSVPVLDICSMERKKNDFNGETASAKELKHLRGMFGKEEEK